MDILKAALLLGMLSLAVVSAAPYLQVQGPVPKTIYNNGSVYLGRIAPGESFYVLANSSTVNNTGYLINIGWDTLNATGIPAGWSTQSSPWYESQMKMKVTVAPNATDGNYSFLVRAINFYNSSVSGTRLGNLTFTAIINVTQDVFNVSVNPRVVHSGIGQPTPIGVVINNTGISDDPFIISARGLPAWNVTDEVISLHSRATSFTYPVFLNEPGLYRFNLTISSSTSPGLMKTFPVSFYVNESLSNDYKAIGQGAVVSPIIFGPVYSFMNFLSYLYNVITSA